MKRIVLFMVMISMVCIASYAQKAAEGTKVLVAYFSATGNTEKAAQQVASIVSGDLHKIQPEKSYTSADLNWRDKSSRSSVEMDDPTSRPAIIDDLKNLAEYDTVYLGFPIWWNQAPRLINTFLEKYDLSGKTVIPFATSGSSNISNAESELRKAYPDVNWQKGKLMNGATEEDTRIGLKINDYEKEFWSEAFELSATRIYYRHVWRRWNSRRDERRLGRYQ